MIVLGMFGNGAMILLMVINLKIFYIALKKWGGNRSRGGSYLNGKTDQYGGEHAYFNIFSRSSSPNGDREKLKWKGFRIVRTV